MISGLEHHSLGYCTKSPLSWQSRIFRAQGDATSIAIPQSGFRSAVKLA